jgi:putative tryptophan/tyrosine transport system substrate-binding protein
MSHRQRSFPASRREFITLLGSAAAAWPLAARAQQRASMPVVGFLDTASADATASFVAAFREGLSEAGYVEGRNVTVEYRWGEGDYGKLQPLAAELVRRGIDVLATVNTPSVVAAKAATQTIPIVFGVGVDPVAFGLVASLNRPGGNLTGVTQLSVEMGAKRLQLLHELVPTAASIALLVNPTNSGYTETEVRGAEDAARVLGVKLLVLNADTESGIAAAFTELSRLRVNALLVSGDSFFVSQRSQFVALAAQHAIPAMYHRREFTLADGLVSYGPSLAEAYHHVGMYTGRILRGEKPADMPVMQPTKFETVLNLKTARALGLTVPTETLLRADEVIE